MVVAGESGVCRDRDGARRCHRRGGHQSDHGEYGWQWRFADACVTDISAVAYDWLATAKPLVITEPEHPAAFRPPSPLLDGLPLLRADRAGTVLEVLRERGLGATDPTPDPRLAELTEYYFGDLADQASSHRFGAAVDEFRAR